MSKFAKLFGGGGGSVGADPSIGAEDREDKSAEQARKRQKLAEKLRRGQRATILAGAEEEDSLGTLIRRPEATSSPTKTKLG